MTTLVNTLEGGTDGTAISAANSGGTSGDAFATLPGLPSGGTREFDNAVTILNTMCAKIANATTSGIVPLRWDFTSTTSLYTRCYYQFSAWPSAAVRIHMGIDTSTTRYSVQLLTTGQIRVLNSSGVTVHTTTATVPTNAPFRLEMFVNITSGQVTTRYFVGGNLNGTTPDEELGPTSITLGAANINKVDFGICVAQTSVTAFWMDALGVSDTTWVGPAVTNQVLKPSADQQDGSWVRNPVVTDLYDAINDSSDTATIDLISSSWPSTARFKLATGSTPISGTRTLRARVQRVGATNTAFTVTLREGGGTTLGGGTLKGTLTTTRSADGWVTIEQTITDAITNYADLYVEVTAATG